MTVDARSSAASSSENATAAASVDSTMLHEHWLVHNLADLAELVDCLAVSSCCDRSLDQDCSEPFPVTTNYLI